MRYSSALHEMLEDIRVPAAYDLYDLQSTLVCDHCQNYLGSRPVTTRCGHSYCRDCLINLGTCPQDGCRSYSVDDCPHDVVLGDLLEEIHRIIAESDAKGVWRKRKRGATGCVKGLQAKNDSSSQGDTESRKANEDSPDSVEGLQLRYKKVDADPSPTTPPKDCVTSPGNIGKATDLEQVDEALSDIKDKKSHSPNPSTLERTKSSPPAYSPTSLSIREASRRLEVLEKQELESEHNDLWKVLRRSVAESFFTCSVCSNCFLEPMTLRCGHTFCRECFHHSIDQTSFSIENGFSQPTCPSCRSALGSLLPSGEAPHHENTWNWTNNLHIWKLINVCWIPELEESKMNYSNSSKLVPPGMDYPLFICTTALPTQPTDLRIFEAKYRTMLRRVLRTKERTFIMCLGSGNPASPHRRVGTLVQINNVVYEELEVHFPVTNPPTKDMETYVYTKGVDRVNIEECVQHDGYLTARISPHHDDPVESEASIESEQVGNDRLVDERLTALNFDPDMLNLDWLAGAFLEYPEVSTRLHNAEILQLLREFIALVESRTTPQEWASEVIENRGQIPNDSHPAEFSWWMVGLFFGSQHDRQVMLEIDSPRKRLIQLLNRVARVWSRVRPEDETDTRTYLT